MKGSDIVISKAGGITTSEALNMNVPLIIFGSTAGQERENTKFLSKSGCAYYARDYKQLLDTLRNVLENRKLIQDMINNSSKIAVSGGSKKIADSIYKRISKINECVEIGSESK